MRIMIFVALVWSACMSPLPAQTPSMEERLYVVLSPTDAERPGSDEMRTLQTGHLANLRSMAEENLLLVAGPLRPLNVETSPAAGILVFASADPELIETATARLENDPMISAGLLRADTYVLFFETGDNLYERRARGVE